MAEHWAYRLRWLVSLASLSSVACDNASLPALPPIETTSDQRVVDQLSAYLHEVEETGYSGIVGIELGDAPPLVFGLGDADQEADRDFTDRTLVPIGSLTKGVLGVMMARLSVDGSVDLQQPLSELLPAGWPLPADKGDLTLHELLTHQSGLPESLGADAEPIEREEFWALAMAAPLSERGIYRYSNVGYSVAMIALEAATDTPHEAFLTGQLTDTGIASIAYRLDGPELATGYDGSRRWGRFVICLNSSMVLLDGTSAAMAGCSPRCPTCFAGGAGSNRNLTSRTYRSHHTSSKAVDWRMGMGGTSERRLAERQW